MDVSLKEIQNRMEELVNKHPSAKVYVKWTCPTCKKRCIANEPNVIYVGGYYHGECCTLYTGKKYGMYLELDVKDRI